MSRIFDLISNLHISSLVSGKEDSSFLAKNFPANIPVTTDRVGNIIFSKLSGNSNAKKIMIDAHLDHIGLCVKGITHEGFLSVSPCGGFDAEILSGTEFNVLGKKIFCGIACSTPPHLLKGDVEKKKISTKDIFIDCGFSSKEEAEKYVSAGDLILFRDTTEKLSFGKIVSSSLDNKASVVALMLTFEKIYSEHDIYFVLSVGEETSYRGAKFAADQIKPDLAIVVDVGFALSPELDFTKCMEMGKGAAVSYTDTLSREMTNWVICTANKHNLPLQIVCEPGGTGTNATALQLRNGGIPSVVISIPLKNMHTSSEIVKESDIEETAKLLCALAKESDFPCQEVVLVERN